ncbi:hypothetical protein VTJ49DRAFT_865 [Mycothermus thermophilus]|uniref:DASH complex subunit SPC34 n=1 Tax=Humicola insolens TaxID=85995 RepID=A0ABR3VNU2_HUMIN
MSLLSAHLEQISISCQGIDSLPFPPPNIFTNALLSNPDITSLIRDTEAHERALFSVPPPPPTAVSSSSSKNKNPNPDPTQTTTAAASGSRRRQTVFSVAAGEVTAGPPPGSARSSRNTAVAAVLGGDLHAQIVRGRSRAGGPGGSSGDVDIEMLLRGAEKLCAVYALPGALERIPALRRAYAQQSDTLAYYERKVAEQQEKLERMNAERGVLEGEEEEEEEQEKQEEEEVGMTAEDLKREEEEVKRLEKRKRELQERLRALDRDLGGLLDV